MIGGRKQMQNSLTIHRKPLDDPMEIDSIYLSDAAQVKERLKHHCSRKADGRFPWTKENQVDRCLREIHFDVRECNLADGIQKNIRNIK